MDMRKDEGYLEFIASENFRNQAEVWYKAYNIIHEKTELFYDFVISLYDIIDETYLGPDVVITESQQKQHFEWCWKKVLHSFEKESIHFRESGQHHDYMWSFFNEAYYMNDTTQNRIREYFTKLFKFDYRKTRSELDMLTEIYKILESNIKK
jgi:hypothetical protein